MIFRRGTILEGQHGRYEIRAALGAGGMGEVFFARDVDDDRRPVAIKRIAAKGAHDDQFVAMFLDEARIGIQLDHPHIIQVIDVGRHDGEFFMALEYIHGVDLRTVFDRCVANQIRIPINLACVVVASVCDALSFAANAVDDRGRHMRVVHRDVSPSNVLIGAQGEIKLIDFGVAKAENRLAYTSTGVIKGKLSYLSPELLTGKPADHRSDVFSAGIVLWELLAGRRLFDADDDTDVFEMLRVCQPPPVSQHNSLVSPQLDAIVAKALARDPGNRYQDAADFRDALASEVSAAGNPWSATEVAKWIEFAIATDVDTGDFPRKDNRSTNNSDKTVKDARTISVEIRSSPPGADIYVVSWGTQQKLGITPLAAELQAKVSFDILLQKPGFIPWRGTIVPSASRKQKISAKLTRSAAGKKKSIGTDTLFLDSTGVITYEPTAVSQLNRHQGNSLAALIRRSRPASFVFLFFLTILAGALRLVVLPFKELALLGREAQVEVLHEKHRVERSLAKGKRTSDTTHIRVPWFHRLFGPLATRGAGDHPDDRSEQT